jgi:hypothetical protein
MARGKKKREMTRVIVRPGVSREAAGPVDGASRYSGPVSVPAEISGTDTILRILTIAENISSTAGGEITKVISSDPTGLSGWTSLSGLYDRYRVLAVECFYEPHSQFNPFVTTTATSVIRQGISVVSDLTDAIPLTSHALAARWGTWKFHNLARPFQHCVKASGKLLMQYNATASTPPVLMSIKLYAGTGLTNSTTYGIIITRMLIQFGSQT